MCVGVIVVFRYSSREIQIVHSVNIGDFVNTVHRNVRDSRKNSRECRLLNDDAIVVILYARVCVYIYDANRTCNCENE